MYEFDEQRWDGQQAEVDHEYNRAGGWLIQKGAAHSRANAVDSQRIYLQIGTGQWCSMQFATLFPNESAAVAYARKFGYVIGQSARIVRCRF